MTRELCSFPRFGLPECLAEFGRLRDLQIDMRGTETASSCSISTVFIRLRDGSR
jgi:hypothetical protein